MSKQVYLIVYDVSDDDMRNKVFRELLKVGIRVQYSVFEVYASESQINRLKRVLQSYIHPVKDSLIIYPLTDEEYRYTKRAGNRLSYAHIYDVFI